MSWKGRGRGQGEAGRGRGRPPGWKEQEKRKLEAAVGPEGEAGTGAAGLDWWVGRCGMQEGQE